MSAPTEAPAAQHRAKQGNQTTSRPTAEKGQSESQSYGIVSWVRFCAHYLRPYRGRFLLLALLLLGSIGLTLVGPQLASLFIDGAAAGAPQAQLILLAALAL